MTEASAEQLQIIGAPLAPMSVIACAGSGKTFTAVRRLAQMRRQLGDHRGRVALLSFSNIAVDTFRQEYQQLTQEALNGAGYGRVEIETLDSFFTGNVLRPHAYRTMGAQTAAFLVTGGETFLNGFRFNTNTYPREITTMQVGCRKWPVLLLLRRQRQHAKAQHGLRCWHRQPSWPDWRLHAQPRALLVPPHTGGAVGHSSRLRAPLPAHPD
ncbi:MAG: UvrD-helicase domain-containing protein [Chiayiivirga sp.]|jgi:hypothetical protein|uniref:UvrD-helicase domain-containing protein n=1 Tax=Chiayiivirga sp. TaxID=2041042 RepID=UPI0025BB9139|nr:UvrD-helicase domain-containing protein [Chiayiivirga sp.]MCI1728523.1 UvrD-helicase domain-containing protein [Chiayiivirga sp.]